ncbi:MAG: endonuclease III [Alkalispirochaeta sp.]
MSGLTERFVEIVTRLETEYGDAPSLLSYRSAFELLIAVILSAQTTDDSVNATLPSLFSRFPDAHRLAEAEAVDVEEIIHPLGFYRQKTRSIIGTARALVAEHGGAVPDTMEALVGLPGVGRKSAGVVLLHIYGTPAIIVDTHFGRVVRRLSFSAEKDPVKLERDVAAILPREHWNDASMRLNYHGRKYCFARKPDCQRCPVAYLCPSAGREI